MSFLSNLGDEQDNIGACMVRLAQAVRRQRDQFLKEHGVTLEQAAHKKKKYNKLWNEWRKGRSVMIDKYV